MPCTTILVGKKASYDGSTIIARNDDSGSGHYTSKKLAVIKPEEQPKIYKSVISHSAEVRFLILQRQWHIMKRRRF